MKSDAALQVIERGESCNLFHLGMNQTHKPFDNAKIREAVALRDQPPEPGRHVLRRQRLRDVATDVDAADDVPRLKDVALPTYDPEKAKALIAESGVPATS